MKSNTMDCNEDDYLSADFMNDSEEKSRIDPEHYRNNSVFTMEPIQIAQLCLTKEALYGAIFLAVLKYIYRYEHKNGLEDLDKAKTYIDFLKADLMEEDILYFLNKELKGE